MHKQVPQEIKEYIIDILSGNISADNAVKLMKWVKESPLNRILFNDFARAWHMTSAVTENHDFNPETAWNSVLEKITKKSVNTEPHRKKLMLQMKVLLRVAAVIVIVLISGILVVQYYNDKNDGKEFVELTAPKGSKSEILLADGSKVWLNSDSKLKYSNNFGKTSRYIELEGEAYFKVAENKDIPFIVHASDINIIALGTAFNVKAYADENTVETTLEEGSVKIEPTSESAGFSKSLILKPNEKAVYNKSESVALRKVRPDRITSAEPEHRKIPVKQERIEVNRVKDVKMYTDWKENRWHFQSETLENLTRKLERRYDVQIIFNDDACKEYTFSGTLHDESIIQILEVIKMTTPIDFKINHKHIEISTNRYLKKKYEEMRIHSNTNLNN